MTTATTTKNQPVWIHGPQGCGKTLNGQRLARHFGLKHVKEVDCIDRYNRTAPPDTLVLSIDEPDPQHVPGVLVLTFAEAMRIADFSRSSTKCEQS